MTCNCSQDISRLNHLINELSDRISSLESIAHNPPCQHLHTTEDYVFDGEDEVRVIVCDDCGEEV